MKNVKDFVAEITVMASNDRLIDDNAKKQLVDLSNFIVSYDRFKKGELENKHLKEWYHEKHFPWGKEFYCIVVEQLSDFLAEAISCVYLKAYNSDNDSAMWYYRRSCLKNSLSGISDTAELYDVMCHAAEVSATLENLEGMDLIEAITTHEDLKEQISARIKAIIKRGELIELHETSH